MGARTAIPEPMFSRPQMTVYLPEQLRTGMRQYQESMDLPTANQAVVEVLKLGLGSSPEAAVVSGIKHRVWNAVNSKLRVLVADALRRIADEFERTSNDPSSWET